jgi:hypothetical protein
MTTLVMTVPHSGTHFLLKFLVATLGLDGSSALLKQFSKESNFDFIHIHPDAGDDPTALCDSLIITLRNPHETVKTGKWAGNKSEQVVDSWQAMIDISDKYKKVLTLVIDGPIEKRYPQLMAIAEHFGKSHLEPQIRKYAEDWEPVNQSITESDKLNVQFAVEKYKQWQQ